MSRVLLTTLAVLALAVPASAQPKAGDTLACDSRDPSRRLFVVVGGVEPFGPGETVAHITLYDEAPGAVPSVVAHLPVALKALVAACPRAANAPRPLSDHFEDGRRAWREAVQTQHAGIFTIPMDQIEDFIRGTLGQAPQP